MTSLAVTQQEVDEQPGITYRSVIERANSFFDDVDLLVVDIVYPERGILPSGNEIHIATAISALASNKSRRPARFVLLLEVLPPPGDPLLSIIENLVEQGILCVIDDEGKWLVAATNGPLFEVADYRHRRTLAKGDVRELFGKKLIRRLGHFRFSNADDFCRRYFYDCSLCTNEIATLIEQYVRDLDPAPEWIVYDSDEYSRWLNIATIKAGRRLGIPTRGSESLLDSEFFGTDDTRYLLVLDFISTGQTLESLLQRWKAPSGIPDLLAVLTASEDDSSDGSGVRTMVLSDHQVDVNYFKAVPLGRVVTTDCLLCQLEIEVDDPAIDDQLMLRTFDFWDLAYESGFKEEDNVPAVREGILHPDFPEMFRNHGAWLADKAARQVVGAIGGNFPAAPVLVVMPDESGVSQIARNFELLHEGIAVVGVPENELALFRNDGSSPMTDSTSLWVSQIVGSSRAAKVVVFEEFSVSGGTKNALTRAVQACGRIPVCHFSFVNFGCESGNLPSLSLYGFPVLLPMQET